MSSATIDVRIDRDRCVGAGQCVLAAPDLFDQDLDEGRSMLLIDPVPAEHEAAATAAALRCPAQAIAVGEE
ncbi:ferredoxin [Microbacterium sp. No. 7]|uniref:ferredoxin n=1 Tax=Microbacterium sp. No. 7 TaxID=1714373 RepID=UPI001E64675D|nr:ferredoxin [Microbacterium sp. No. 7]